MCPPPEAPRPHRWAVPVAVGLLLVTACSGGAPGSSAVPEGGGGETSRYTLRPSETSGGTGKFYFGREIAQVMGHEGADWLERPERRHEERPDLLLDILEGVGLRPGAVVADIGAGSGYLTFPLAERVGPRGEVLAVDIQPEMLSRIRRKMAARGIDHVTPVLGTETDPRLPTGRVELALLVDVYHELSHPWEMMRAIVDALVPGGRVVLVEYRAEDPDLPIHPLHEMTAEQVRREMEPHEVVWIDTLERLPRQHVLVFEKPGA